ncbi:MAG: class I SAM-dependent methyltransferase [Treponema sp.]|jgi:2-polyprenyl-3-methyl-5-hydroxy-6-metoxy-1,4-benzoquinol methylase|nr:class I SAM-dependent methyltransferase [Treponema sp.]
MTNNPDKNAPVTKQEIIDGYRFMLNRLPESEKVIDGRLRSNMTFKQFHDELWNCPEFKTGRLNSFYDFRFDCAFPPYNVEYKSSPENIQKIVSHIETVWSNYGKDEAYWSVLTHSMFLRENLTNDAIETFYASGKDTMRQIEATLRRCGEWERLNRNACMEYGCGVGRVTIQLANIFEQVTGLDISQGHLELARQHINALLIKNINVQKIDRLEDIARLPKYDFIFTVIVLQHNPPPIIAILIESFFKLLKKDGIVIFQVPVQIAGYTFSVDDYISQMNDCTTMEMHMLPQSEILKIARENNCYPLEIHGDHCTSDPQSRISETFVFKKLV